MTKGEFNALTDHMDDDAEIFVSSIYDEGDKAKMFNVVDLIEIDMYLDCLETTEGRAISLIFSDSE